MGHGRRFRSRWLTVVAFVALAAGLIPPAAADAAPTARHGLGLVVSHPASAARSTIRSAPASLPASVDLTPWAVPVGDQGQVNSCSAWATDYAALGYWERRQAIAGGVLAPMYTYSQVTGGQDVGTTIGSHLQIAEQQGVDNQADYWQGTTDFSQLPTAAETTNAANWKLTTASELSVYRSTGATVTQQSIEAALSAGEPVVIGFPVYQNLEALSAAGHGFYAGPAGELLGSHAVTALGYDVTGLRIENSWGAYWGDKGFATLSWSFVNSNVEEAVAIGQLAGSGPVGSAPINTGLPGVGGIPRLGQALTSTAGSWSPAVSSYAFQWQRSSDGGATWANITGATGVAYLPQTADLGAYLRVLVTAVNGYGQGHATSGAIGPLLAALPKPVVRPLIPAPQNTARPSVSGDPQVGQTLQAGTGSWRPSGNSYVYAWQRSTDGGVSWSNIGSATQSSYLITRSDAGATLRVKVTARNRRGSASALSTAVGPVPRPGALAVKRARVSARHLTFAAVVSGSDGRPEATATAAGRSVRLRAHGHGGQFRFTGELSRGRWVVKVSLTGSGLGASASSATTTRWFVVVIGARR